MQGEKASGYESKIRPRDDKGFLNSDDSGCVQTFGRRRPQLPLQFCLIRQSVDFAHKAFGRVTQLWNIQ